MSVSDLIDRGLFTEGFMGDGKKICRLEDFPEEMKYKREKYDEYKNFFTNKILFLKNLLSRMSFIATWDIIEDEEYIRQAGFNFLETIVLNFNCLKYNLSRNEIFQIIVKLLWSNMVFSTDEIPLLLQGKNYNKDKIYIIQNIIERLSNALNKFYYPHLNSEYLIERRFNGNLKDMKKAAFQVEKYDDINTIPSENILICLNPNIPMQFLFDEVKAIVITELQNRNIEKAQITKNGGILSDAEIKEMIGYNLLFFLDIYLFSKVYNVNLDGTVWSSIAYNGTLGKNAKEEENNRNKTSKIHLNFMKKNMNKVYIQKILRRINAEEAKK